MAQPGLPTKSINIGENVVDIAFLHRPKDVLVVAMSTGIINVIEPDSGIILATAHLRSRPASVSANSASSTVIVGMEDGSAALMFCGTRDDGEQLLDLKHAWDISSRAVKLIFAGSTHVTTGTAILAGPGSNKLARVSTSAADNFAVKDEVQLKEEVISASLVEHENVSKLWVLGRKRHKSGEPAFPNVVTALAIGQDRVRETNRHGMAVACTAIHGSASVLDNFLVSNASDKSIAEWRAANVEAPGCADPAKSALTLVRIFQTGHELAVEKLLLRGRFLFTVGADMKVGRLDVSRDADESNYALVTRHGYSSEFAVAAAVNPHNTRLITVVKNTAKTTDLTPLHIDPPKRKTLDSAEAEDESLRNRKNVDSIMTALESASDWRLRSEEIFDRAMDAKAKQQQLLRENEAEPEPLHKLKPEEYAFDAQEVLDYEEEKAAESEKLRHSIEDEVEAYERRCAEIKRRCWDSREVPLKTLSGFQTSAKVSTFDILRTDGDAQQQIPSSETLEACATNEPDPTSDIALLFGPVRNPKLREILEENYVYLREQSDLDTVEKQSQQVEALNKIIHDLQVHLNSEFDALLQDKQRRIKNFARAKTRTKEIHEELLFLHQELPAQVAKFLTDGIEIIEHNFEEMPELIFQRFEVKRDPRAVSPAARDKTPEQKKQHPGPSPIPLDSEEFGKSALMGMMNGVLEPKREELLRREIPVPQFVLTKPREEWNNEDHAAFDEYQEQVDMLERERTEYKNELLEEIDRMESQVAASKLEFDAKLETLASLKVDVATLVARAKLAAARIMAEINEIERLEEAGVELEGEMRELAHAARERKVEIRGLEPMAAFCTRFRATWTERGSAIDREATELIARHSASSKAQETTWCAFKSHPTTFSSAVASVVAAYEDLREPCKPVSAANVESLSQELDEMDKARPTGLPPDAWAKLAALRRERITCDLNQKLADNLIIKCQSKIQTASAELKAAELALDEKKFAHKLIAEQLDKLRTNPNVQVVLPWSQCEADQYDFVNGLEPKAFTVLPESEVIGLDREIRTVTEKSAEHFRNLARIRDRLEKAQRDEQEYVQMCEEIFRELHKIEKFKLDREAQEFLRNGLEPRGFQSAAAQLESEFVEKRLADLERRSEKLQAQIQAKIKENAELDRKVSDLEQSLVHPLSGIDLSSMFTERLEPIWREKQLKELIVMQKDRIMTLERELESLNMRTYPTLLNGPPNS